MRAELALDLGTTTLAGRLLSPAGEILAEAQLANPQRELAADVLLRLQLAHVGDGGRLQALLIDGLRRLIRQLCLAAGCQPGDVIASAAAGNTGVSCLLQALPVSALLFPPHKPPYKELVHITADEIDLGLSVPLQLFPPVSGFVGGDLVAALLSVESFHQFNDATVVAGTLLIDIGTNAELALWDGYRWWVTSAAAGPAFEGGNIGAGMILTAGAITDVRSAGDRLQLTVAGGGQPRGLCGSGLAALVAAARQGGLIDGAGRILSPDEVETNLSRYLVKQGDSWAICFHRSAAGELLLTQTDLRNLQLAKGAVRAGVEVLLERGGIYAENIPLVLVTGALGTALPVEVLKRVALLPEPMLDKTSFVANGVLAGLQTYLTGTDSQQRLAALMTRIQPFPLSGTPAFEKHFLASLEFI
ncbi:MAG: ASKHA domain-containing protein [Desulfuromonadales bacterium]